MNAGISYFFKVIRNYKKQNKVQVNFSDIIIMSRLHWTDEELRLLVDLIETTPGSEDQPTLKSLLDKPSASDNLRLRE